MFLLFSYTGERTICLLCDHLLLRDGVASSIVQKTSFVQQCWVVVEWFHFRIPGCEKAKKVVCFLWIPK